MNAETIVIGALGFIIGFAWGVSFTLWVFKAIATYKGDSNHD